MREALPALATWTLLAARVAPAGVVLSFASAGALPLWLALSVSLAIAAGLASGAQANVVHEGPLLIWALMRELALGLAFASATALPFFALGAGLRTAEGRTLSARSALGTLYVLAAAALALSLGGLRAYVKALSASLVELPLGGSAPGASALLAETQSIVTQAIMLALSLGLPLLFAIWLLDLACAVVLRLAHAPGRVEALPLRRALVLLVLSLACAPWVSRMPELTREALLSARATVLRLGR